MLGSRVFGFQVYWCKIHLKPRAEPSSEVCYKYILVSLLTAQHLQSIGGFGKLMDSPGRAAAMTKVFRFFIHLPLGTAKQVSSTSTIRQYLGPKSRVVI